MGFSTLFGHLDWNPQTSGRNSFESKTDLTPQGRDETVSCPTQEGPSPIKVGVEDIKKYVLEIVRSFLKIRMILYRGTLSIWTLFKCVT